MAPIHWHSVFFLVFATVACGCAVAVALSNHIVRMAFYLVLSLAGAAALFFLAGADFVGVMQVMIYVGATLVVLIFGVMLTAQGPFISMKARGGEWVLSLVAGGALLVILLQASLGVARWRAASGHALAAASPPTAARLGLGLLGARVDRLESSQHSRRGQPEPGTSSPLKPPTLDKTSTPDKAPLPGEAITARDTRGMAGYLLPFEIISVHLLVVLVGAVHPARPKRRASSDAEQPDRRGTSP